MKRKGMNYDVGRVLLGHLQRPTFDTTVVHRELEIIKNDLHCNAVKIQGYDIDRLMTAAEDALEQGLEVWLAPELFEMSQQETFDYTVQAAAAAETLRQKWPELVLSIGTELTLFMQGIVEGNTLMERIGNPTFRQNLLAGKYMGPLNAYLARTNEAVRHVFHGNVTYASVARIETVDWRIFDFVSVDIYLDRFTRDTYGDLIKQYFVYNKPVVIAEFGCCTYQGAEDMGGMGWSIVDWEKMPPQLKGDYVYDQGVQARELTDQLRILDEVGVDGAFVFTFVQPGPDIQDAVIMEALKDLTFDPDIVSYSLVKSYIDRRGTTYPDMPWEPKESFKAVADFYAKN
ncbi:MAG: abortive infection protein [Ktedonobacteraceae bacterium]